MSKAILILNEMPKNCGECDLKYLDTGDDAYFGPNVYRCVLDDSEISKNERQYDCPLKPLPHKNKYDVEKYATVDYENKVTLGHFLNKGWNDCIDEILGE